LKQQHEHCFEVRVKADAAVFARKLTAAGCTVDEQDDALLVRLPPGQSERMIWSLAAETGAQVRHLRPQRGSLEEVFLKAVQ
jgi:hypothetical protein